MEHYIFLPSNSNPLRFPDNTPNDYTVHLERALKLTEGRWMVGLSQMIYVSSLFTVENDINVIITGQKKYSNELRTCHPARSIRCSQLFIFSIKVIKKIELD
jgi:hypothetical protein